MYWKHNIFTTDKAGTLTSSGCRILKDKRKLFTVNVLEIQYFTINTSLITNEQWI